ncbi:hypothetical protein FLM48_22130 [Shewanella sp. Scap07]|nr:hypothetical protein FLM48_22130 [Shewanella sp. Scap07]
MLNQRLAFLTNFLTNILDLDFKLKSLLLLFLESGLKYIIVIEYIYSYILNDYISKSVRCY